MLERRHPDWGVDRIRDVLMRSQGYTASSGAIQRLLLSQGYEVAAVATAPHPPKRAHRFERARPNQMWLKSATELQCPIPTRFQLIDGRETEP
jgi:hypothetical protein